MPSNSHPPALSTMWMQLRHDRLDAFVASAAEAGFRHVELSHVVTEEMLAHFAPPPGIVRVLHHPCPNDGRMSELSDPDESHRARAVRAAIRTLETAADLGAAAVVLHLGVVASVDRRWENAMRARWLAGQGDAPEAHALRETILQLRAAHAAPYLDVARRSLDLVIRRAAELEIAVGLENGEWLASIPSLEESEALLADLPSRWVGAWLDTGHATILERLGGPPLTAWAARLSPRLVGLHYHDVAGLRDHLIPGLGTIDFAALAPFIPPAALPTCEFDWYFTGPEILAGVQYLAAAGLVAWPPQEGDL